MTKEEERFNDKILKRGKYEVKPSGEAAIAAKYDEVKAATEKRMAKMEPLYSDDYLDLLLSPEEMIDVQKQLDVGPMVRINTKQFNDMVLKNAKEKAKNVGLPSILMVDASNKPPTLDDYLRLGITISQLSEEERKTVQQMLDSTLNRKEEK